MGRETGCHDGNNTGSTGRRVHASQDDFGWFAKLATLDCVFVTHLKANTRLRDATARAVAPGGVVLSDRLGHLPKRLAFSRRNPFPQTAREVVIRSQRGKLLRLFTNDLTRPAETIADLYKAR
jgi:hypothetical protein